MRRAFMVVIQTYEVQGEMALMASPAGLRVDDVRNPGHGVQAGEEMSPAPVLGGSVYMDTSSSLSVALQNRAH